MMKKFKVGISSCNSNESYESGQTLVNQAIVNGNIDNPSIVLAFCSGRHNHDKFLQGIRSSLLGDVPVIGGSCIGVITNNELCYSSHPEDENYPAALALMELPNTIKCRWVSVEGINDDEEKTGKALGEKIRLTPDDKAMFMVFDSVKSPPNQENPPLLNSAASMLAGLISELGAFELPIIGGGVIGDYGFGSTRQFCGFSVKQQNIAAIVFSGDLECHSSISHGCSLLSGEYHKITKAQGPIIYELDGQPIVPIINTLFGNNEWQKQIPLKTLTLGMNETDKFSDFNEQNYNNSLILGLSPDKNGIMLFDADLREDDEVQFMLRDSFEMIESAREKTFQLIESLKSKGKNPVFAMYIDCAGRTSYYSGTTREEAMEVQSILNENNIPLLGFYSGIEIAPVAGKVKSLDWTGVLMILTV